MERTPPPRTPGVVDLPAPAPRAASAFSTPAFSLSSAAAVDAHAHAQASAGEARRPASMLMGNAPVFVPGAAAVAGHTPSPSAYRPKLKLAFPQAEGTVTGPGPGALAQRRKHRRNGSREYRGREPPQQQYQQQVQVQQAHAPRPSYPPGFAFSASPALPAPPQSQSQAQAQRLGQEEHPLVRWWKHFSAEELDRLQNALQDLMFTASRLVDEDARRAGAGAGGTEEEHRTEAWEMREAQVRLGQWVQGLLGWREGLPAGDPRSKN
ncbi:hypothetical protein CALCODRAFT_478977 [Calocera cornea HHB12733]|uniref:Uncharacterized protein n=1 Tax=Calocera cornea HHB12733 TaxID=1353952 RepID=A0A165K4X6_9BASI|nr:hypothetical protein CALCODRAFT_478977 [Calocera cornea HHB12733]